MKKFRSFCKIKLSFVKLTLGIFLLLNLNFISAGQIGIDLIPTPPTHVTIYTNESSADYWDNLNTFNTTQMENSNELLNIKESWLSTLPKSSSKISWDSDSDIGGYRLTNVGSIIMIGLIYTYDVIPVTDGLYSLGNSSNWYNEIYANSMYAEGINTTNLNSSNINSDVVDTTNLTSSNANITNATIAGHDIYRDGGGNFNINLD